MTRPPRLAAARVNAYLADKQGLARAGRRPEVEQTTRDIVALHASSPTSPYLSLWARLPHFGRETLETALYRKRSLAKMLCMRATLHVLPSDEVAIFVQACRSVLEKRTPPRFRDEGLLVQAGICGQAEAQARWADLQAQILAFLAQQGPATVSEITDAVPVLQTKIHHDAGTRYAGSFSIGTRVVYAMCAQGLLIRTQIRGSWRSSLYEYAPLAEWLPEANLATVDRRTAQAKLVRRYLAGFGPASAADAQWWTGLTKTEIQRALQVMQDETVAVEIEGLAGEFLMLAADLEPLRALEPPGTGVTLLPELDPYIMGYQDRRRFLDPAQQAKLFDRAGNAVPTVWIAGRIAGAWGQRDDGRVVTRLFEPVSRAERALLDGEAARLTEFLAGEYLPPRYGTAFTKDREAFG
ncbi:MAG: winged helix DNA-binding domain-containing protein [Anaerolineae bacterium]